MIQHKGRLQECTTGFVSAFLTKGRIVDEEEKIELWKEERILEALQEARVCKQADRFLQVLDMCHLYSNIQNVILTTIYLFMRWHL